MNSNGDLLFTNQKNFGGETHNNAIEITLANFRDVTKKLPAHASAVLKAITQIKYGSLSIQLPDKKVFQFDSSTPGPNADITLHNWQPAKKTLLGGSIGLAESYIDGDWDSSNVTTFLELFSVNYDLGEELATPSLFSVLVERFRHWLNENTRNGSKKNISAHYDLGNNFYKLWLDKSMTYSSAIYEKNTNSLQAAQQAKYSSLVKRLNITDSDHVLEIGCGWGGFAEHVAKNTGAKLTGLTISKEQLEFAKERIFKAGLNEKVDLKFQDYRDEQGIYDKIASIEMFEAVGEKYWESYYSKLRDCLVEGGKAGLQIITITEQSFKSYRDRPDFIQRYVFPGGMLPTPAILSNLSEKFGLVEEETRIFGQDYARTLAEWRVTFWEKWETIRTLGFDERFKRMWEFYFHYCEAGFKSENTDVRQIFYQKN